MNERIYELAEYALVTGEYSDGSGTWGYLDKEKFVELILDDVAQIVDDLYCATPPGYADILLILDENIKKHFYGDDSE